MELSCIEEQHDRYITVDRCREEVAELDINMESVRKFDGCKLATSWPV